MLSKGLIDDLIIRYPELEDYFVLAEDVLIASDFREKKEDDEFWGISFLLSDLDSIQSFDYYRIDIKKRYNYINKEIKYSAFNPDEKRPELLNEFINAADTIRGILFNFVIDSSFVSIFNDSESERKKLKGLSRYKFNDYQKLELFSHLVGIVISSIKSKIVSLKWITDKDNLLNNPKRKKISYEYLFNTIDEYKGANNIMYEFIDPNLDSPDMILADLSNISDLIVGPMVDIYNQYLRDDIEITADGVSFPTATKFKAISYSEWFFSNYKNLKKVNYMTWFDPKSNQINFTEIHPKWDK